MNRKPVIGTILVLIAAACSIKNPSRDEPHVPVLGNLSVADTLFLNAASGNAVSVSAADPEGWSDIARVTCMVFSGRKLWEQSLLDDGNRGDILPRDGVFFGLLKDSSFGGMPGKYRLGVLAEDAEGNRSDTLFAPVVVTAGELNGRPSVSNPAVEDSVRADGLNSLFFSVRADDPQGLGDVQSVYFDLYAPLAASAFYHGILHDDGIDGDETPNDGIFSLREDFSNTLKTLGLHQVRFEARDKKGAVSIPATRTFFVTGVNEPPVLSDLSAPDQVTRQSVLPILLAVKVSDPQGLHDIRRVYFNTTKPDGTPSAGNPFLMFDDGTQGDKVAGDGVYSLNIYITPQNALGSYRFEFFAEDLSGAVSGSLVQIIAVMDAN